MDFPSGVCINPATPLAAVQVKIDPLCTGLGQVWVLHFNVKYAGASRASGVQSRGCEGVSDALSASVHTCLRKHALCIEGIPLEQ